MSAVSKHNILSIIIFSFEAVSLLFNIVSFFSMYYEYVMSIVIDTHITIG